MNDTDYVSGEYMVLVEHYIKIEPDDLVTKEDFEEYTLELFDDYETEQRVVSVTKEE